METADLRTDWLSPREAGPFLGGLSGKAVLALFRVGTRTRDGRRIRLESQAIGSRLYTTERWIREHLAAVREADRAAEATDATPARPPESPDRQAERFGREKELAAAALGGRTTNRRGR